jgi:hypothetical protein
VKPLLRRRVLSHPLSLGQWQVRDQNPDRYRDRDSNRHSNSNTPLTSKSHSIGPHLTYGYRYANGSADSPLACPLLLYPVEGKRFVMQADEKLTAFLVEAAICTHCWGRAHE